MTSGRVAQLFRAMRRTNFNKSATARLLGVSRETVRQWLLSIEGEAGLIARAVKMGELSKAEGDDLAAAVALAHANRQGANLSVGANGEGGANSSEIRHLRDTGGAPILSAGMSTAAMEAVPQSSTVRVNGADREFAKRVALELSLKLGLPREDLSVVVSRMIRFFRSQADPAKVAEMLIEAMDTGIEHQHGSGE